MLASLLRRLGRDEAGVAWHGRVESQQALDDFKMEMCAVTKVSTTAIYLNVRRIS